MAQPEMAPILGRPAVGKKSRASLLGVVEAFVLLAVMLLGFWHGVHALQHAVHVHHTLMVLFPIFGVASLLLILPPIMYLGFAAEFSGLHPAWPPHFLFLVKRLLRALSSSRQLKVSAKEL